MTQSVPEDCPFCGIVAGRVPAEIVNETEEAVVVRDINSQAPVHLLVLSRSHFADVFEAGAQSSELLGALFSAAVQAARAAGLAGDGFRLVVNTGRDGGQTIPHLHIHVLGGREMHWPPG